MHEQQIRRGRREHLRSEKRSTCGFSRVRMKKGIARNPRSKTCTSFCVWTRPAMASSSSSSLILFFGGGCWRVTFGLQLEVEAHGAYVGGGEQEYIILLPVHPWHQRRCWHSNYHRFFHFETLKDDKLVASGMCSDHACHNYIAHCVWKEKYTSPETQAAPSSQISFAFTNGSAFVISLLIRKGWDCPVVVIIQQLGRWNQRVALPGLCITLYSYSQSKFKV